jgi:hypothetical protein
MNDHLDAYCGPAEIHDARVLRVLRSGQQLTVELETAEGRPLIVEFVGVTEVAKNKPVGMMLYALREDRSLASGRRYRFLNWDEDDDASLVVAAEGVSFR